MLLAKEIMADLSPSDPDRDERLRGYETMKGGVATMLFGSLATLSERSIHQAPDLLRLAAFVEETLPVFLGVLPEASRKELPVRLRKLIESETDLELKAALSRMLAQSEAP